MAAADLIDTTEMYLKTIFELEEDGVVPMRARIVERLGHSGPTVSQTIARMEGHDLVTVCEDRRLAFTEQGRHLAEEVMRKHRLAECLLISVIGLDWVSAHDEACRWEHVMSDDVEERLVTLLDNPERDPYGNAVPGSGGTPGVGISVEDALANLGAPGGSPGKVQDQVEGVLLRIGEPIQAERSALEALSEEGVFPGSVVAAKAVPGGFQIWRISPTEASGEVNGSQNVVTLSSLFSPHLFLEIPKEK